MPVIHSKIDVNSTEFAENAELMQTQIDGFRQLEQAVIAAAESKKARYEKRGLLLPRERLARPGRNAAGGSW